MSVPDTVQYLGRVYVISVDINQWTARKRLHLEDTKADASQLPPTDLASLGSKKIIDPEKLAVFKAIYKRAHRVCEKAGISFLGAYAVPRDKGEQIVLELNALKDEFYIEKEKFLDAYEANIQAWLAKHPDWKHALQNAFVPKDEVDAQIQFTFRAFTVSTTDSDLAAMNDGFAEATTGMSHQLFTEVAEAAAALIEKSFLGKDNVSHKVFSPIRLLRGKLDGLAFLDPRVTPLVRSIDETLDALPKQGWINGNDLRALHGLVLMLSDTKQMIRHGAGILDGANAGFFAATMQPSQAAAEATEEDAEDEESEDDVTAELALEQFSLPADDISLNF